MSLQWQERQQPSPAVDDQLDSASLITAEGELKRLKRCDNPQHGPAGNALCSGGRCEGL